MSIVTRSTPAHDGRDLLPGDAQGEGVQDLGVGTGLVPKVNSPEHNVGGEVNRPGADLARLDRLVRGIVDDLPDPGSRPDALH